jgi:carbamoyl-phosphate synthase large subunit
MPWLWCVKCPVFSFRKLPGEDPVGGPEMKSTGEVMGIGFSFGNAFAKAYRATGQELPRKGTAFLSVHDRDKRGLIPVAMGLYQLGFTLVATQGTAAFLQRSGLPVQLVGKRHEGAEHIGDWMMKGKVHLIINTPVGKDGHEDDRYIRQIALGQSLPCLTTLTAAKAVVEAIRAIKSERMLVHCLQDWKGFGGLGYR